MKMNLSRAAKKFHAEMPQVPEAPKRAKDKKKSNAPPPVAVPEPVVTVAPTPEPTPVPMVPDEVPAPAPQPRKAWPVKAKHPRFVREKVERRERPATPALPPRSTKFTARLLTMNLAVPPKEDVPPPR